MDLLGLIIRLLFLIEFLKWFYKNVYEGYFAIDVKSRAEQWRIIIQPLDKDDNPYDPCSIDELSEVIECVMIREVSKHNE